MAGAVTKGNISADPSAFEGDIGSSAAPGGGIGGIGDALMGGVGSFLDGIGDIFGGSF